MFSPFPTFQMRPFFRRFRRFSMFFQTRESLAFLFYIRNTSLCRYLALMACTHRLSLLLRICQASLHWKASLTASVFRSSKPPLFFGRHSLSHTNRSNSFSAWVLHQKNSLLILSRCWLVVAGIWKHCIVCAGSDSSWDWINTVLPALDKQLAFQPCSLLVALWIIFLKVVFEGLP